MDMNVHTGVSCEICCLQEASKQDKEPPGKTEHEGKSRLEGSPMATPCSRPLHKNLLSVNTVEHTIRSAHSPTPQNTPFCGLYSKVLILSTIIFLFHCILGTNKILIFVYIIKA